MLTLLEKKNHTTNKNAERRNNYSQSIVQNWIETSFLFLGTYKFTTKSIRIVCLGGADDILAGTYNDI